MKNPHDAMKFHPRIKQFLLHYGRSREISRRYFITNGFDGALTILGLMMGFYLGDNNNTQLSVAIALKASLGAAIALFISGLSSAYLSESAERKKELHELEQALLADLSESDYGKTSRFAPKLVALVNGLSPLIISLLILTPLWLFQAGFELPASPFLLAIIVGLIIIFLLGVLLGKLSKEFWVWTGLKALVIAGVTVSLIIAIQ